MIVTAAPTSFPSARISTVACAFAKLFGARARCIVTARNLSFKGNSIAIFAGTTRICSWFGPDHVVTLLFVRSFGPALEDTIAELLSVASEEIAFCSSVEPALGADKADEGSSHLSG